MPPSISRINHRGGAAQSNLPPKAERQFIGRICTSDSDPSRKDYESCALACSVNVKLSTGLTGAVDVAGNDISDAFLTVEFGGGDSDLSVFDMDLIDGTSFPAIGQLNVYLNYPIVTGQQVPIVQPNLDISISVGTGCVGAQGAIGCRRTIKVGSLGNNAASAVIPIPKFAVQAVYANATVGVATAQFDQVISTANGAPVISSVLLGKTQAGCVPIINGARGFIVTSTQGATTLNAIIFDLSPA